jgi:hypothetical protein
LEDSNNLRQHLENNYSINEIKNKYQLFMGKIVEDCIDYYNQEQSWDDDTEEDGFLGKI